MERDANHAKGMSAAIWRGLRDMIDQKLGTVHDRRRVTSVTADNRLVVTSFDPDETEPKTISKLRDAYVEPGDDVLTLIVKGSEIAVGTVGATLGERSRLNLSVLRDGSTVLDGVSALDFSGTGWIVGTGALGEVEIQSPAIAVSTLSTANITSSTPALVPGLTFTIPANSRWTFTSSFSTYPYGGDGMQFGIRVPSGGTAAMQGLATTTSPTVWTGFKLTAAETMSPTVCNTNTNNGFARLSGVVTAGDTGGTVGLLWRAATNGQNNAIDVGASLVATRIA
jgi:hypothetical protein